MSRYTCHCLVNLSPKNVRATLQNMLADCQLETIYELEDYLMAREIPGRVSFSKLVAAEVFIDITSATTDAVTVSFVLKNEELPLNRNNHCRQIFDRLRVAISQHDDWHSINSLQPISTGSPVDMVII